MEELVRTGDQGDWVRFSCEYSVANILASSLHVLVGKGLGKSRSCPSDPKRDERRRDDDRDRYRDRDRERDRDRYRDRRRRSRSRDDRDRRRRSRKL